MKQANPNKQKHTKILIFIYTLILFNMTQTFLSPLRAKFLHYGTIDILHRVSLFVVGEAVL